MKIKIEGDRESLIKFLDIGFQMGISIFTPGSYRYKDYYKKGRDFSHLYFISNKGIEISESPPTHKEQDWPTVNLPNQANLLLEKMIHDGHCIHHIPKGWFYLTRTGDGTYIMKKSLRTHRNSGVFMTAKNLAHAMNRPNDFYPTDPEGEYFICPLTGKLKAYPLPPYTIKVSLWNNTIILNKELLVFNGEVSKSVNQDLINDE